MSALGILHRLRKGQEWRNLATLASERSFEADVRDCAAPLLAGNPPEEVGVVEIVLVNDAMWALAAAIAVTQIAALRGLVLNDVERNMRKAWAAVPPGFSPVALIAVHRDAIRKLWRTAHPQGIPEAVASSLDSRDLVVTVVRRSELFHGEFRLRPPEA